MTGGSSGIGLATTNLLLDHGAIVVSGDIHECPLKHKNLASHIANVVDWSSLSALFDKAKDQHGRIDHVFANAGISGRADYVNPRLNEQGKLLEPDHTTLDTNLKAVINTAYLAIHHFKSQSPPTGSIVCTASIAAVQHFRAVDYAAAKHGVLGLVRGLIPALAADSVPVRVNAIAPHWTTSGMVPAALLDAIGQASQGPEAVARAVALLMADESRQGQLVMSREGKHFEIGQRLNEVTDELTGTAEELNGTTEKLVAFARQHGQAS
ncbi:hypothetical protein LTR78_006556 [Recurvomyces mirabilis]|uniref:Uncharacterized protein n=1 Tax=Recurvomyces mirabilis TaxID=574656 RepID=A0AAE0WKZ4_9PEZI|nr:hypothetical protein LTR78_006556 [Recurvomyces mirabilis]KAK5151026.1 hypothetical protein LTS14_009521 [Recurvomyces mirabilis]